MLIHGKLPYTFRNLVRYFHLLPGLDNDSPFYQGTESDTMNFGTMSTARWNRLRNGGNDFINQHSPVETVPPYAKRIVLVFLRNRFFCEHNRKMVEYFFDDLRTALDLKAARQPGGNGLTEHERQELSNLLLWPNCDVQLPTENLAHYFDVIFQELRDTDEWNDAWDNAAKNDSSFQANSDFWLVAYYCLLLIVERSLSTANRIESVPNPAGYSISEQEIIDVQKVYKKLCDPSSLYSGWTVLEIEQGQRTPASTQQNTGAQPTGLPFAEVERVFSGNGDLVFIYQPYVKPRRDYDPAVDRWLVPCSDLYGNAILLPYIPVYNAPDSGGLLNAGVTIDIREDQTIDITAQGVDYLQKNRQRHWLEKQNNDIRVGRYKPFSYPKVHIDSFYQHNISPGEEASRDTKIELRAIEYYDHLIARDYFSGKLFRSAPRSPAAIQARTDCAACFNPGDFTTAGFQNTKAFFLLAGEGTWVLSSDGYIMVSVRNGMVQEVPGDFGYTSAGSLEYTARFLRTGKIGQNEANPFITAARELYEETALIKEEEIKKAADKIELIAFGIDTNRFLEQFSFYYPSDKTALAIIDSANAAESQEQTLFGVKFTEDNISKLIRSFPMEPGAVYSLLRLWRMLKNRKKSN